MCCDERAEVPGDAVADGVGDVQRRRALARRRPAAPRSMKSSVGAARVLGRELDVVACARGPGPHRRRSRLSTWSSVISQHVLHVARGLVEMNTWMRGRSAWRTASQHRSTSWKPVRDRAVMTGPRTADRAIASTASKSPGARDREPGLDVVDPEARQLLGDLELLGDVERDARRLLAVAQRRVEDPQMVGHGWLLSSCLLGTRKTSSARRHEEASASTGVLAAT